MVSTTNNSNGSLEGTVCEHGCTYFSRFWLRAADRARRRDRANDDMWPVNGTTRYTSATVIAVDKRAWTADVQHVDTRVTVRCSQGGRDQKTSKKRVVANQ